MNNLPIIAITMGDPAGIGLEIILKTCSAKDLYTYCRPVIVGNAQSFNSYKTRFNLNTNIVSHQISTLDQSFDSFTFSPEFLNIIDCSSCVGITEGNASKEGGTAAGECIKTAVDLVLAEKADAITTAPINKEALNMAGFMYPGHTEMLAELTGSKNFAMMLAGGGIRVVLATIHTAINNVSDLLNISMLEGYLNIIDDNMKFFGIEKPAIAVSALNPHAGESGLFGMEEQDIIIPAIEKAVKNGINVSGPFPADTLFVKTNRIKYDVILVMYHDQGLIPLKMAAFGKAVNVTLGLPIIRTSVDHGTAYDIAGKNVADPSSLKEAVKLAAEMVEKRFQGAVHK